MFFKYTKKKHDKSDDWSERLLIENWLGFKLSQHDKLCANHRYTLGVGYKQSKRWQHPHHQPEIGKKGLFQYIDVFPLQKSTTCYFQLSQCYVSIT